MTLPRRLTMRLNDEDYAWLERQAEDEGVDVATMGRLILNRLRRGRVPLLSMMGAEAVRRQGHYEVATKEEGSSEPIPEVEVDRVLEGRMQELDNNVVPINGPAPEPAETAAISLRHVPRTSYNPGRS